MPAGTNPLAELLRSQLQERGSHLAASGRFAASGHPDRAPADSPPTCPTCGTPVPENSRFCSQCGHALAAALQPPPEGTITILFTDIEGWTALANVLGNQRALEVIRDHNSIVRTCIQRAGGFEVKTQGDGFMVAFASARRAILCAVDIQRSIARYNRERSATDILVRIGINAGDALHHEEDFFGVAVNLAARVAAWAEGGQILVSGLVRGLAGPVHGIEYIPRGRIEARGFAYRFRLYEVRWLEEP